MVSSKNNDDAQKLSLLTKIGFGSGDLALNFIFGTINFWLLFFYTNVFNLSSATAGILFVVVCIVDIAFTFNLGFVIDKKHPKLGKYRSYLVYGGIPLTIFAILCFWNGFSGSIIYACITYAALILCYSLVNTPYCAINTSLTNNRSELNTLVSFRMVMATIGSLAVSAGIPVIVGLFAPKDNFGRAIINTADSSNAWLIAISIYAIIGFVILLFCFSQCKERISMSQTQSSNLNLKKDILPTITKNKPVLVLLLLFLAFCFVYSISNASGSYFITNYIQASSNEISWFTCCGILPAFLVYIAWPIVRKKFSVKPIFYISILISLFGIAMFFCVYFFEPLKGQLWFIYIAQFIKSFGIFVLSGCIWALVPEVVIYCEQKSKYRISGVINAIMVSGSKTGIALGQAITGLLLSFFNLENIADIASGSTDIGIYVILCIIPAIVIILGFLIVKNYDLEDTV